MRGYLGSWRDDGVFGLFGLAIWSSERALDGHGRPLEVAAAGSYMQFTV